MEYRFNPRKGFRRQGKPYGEMDDLEFDSEDYDSVSEWFDAIKEYFVQDIKEPDEEVEGTNDS